MSSAVSALLGAEPLLYLGAWLSFQGRWIAYLPQSAKAVHYVTAAGATLGLAAVTIAIQNTLRKPLHGWWRLAMFGAALLAATGVGCAVGWWPYMAVWHI